MKYRAIRPLEMKDGTKLMPGEFVPRTTKTEVKNLLKKNLIAEYGTKEGDDGNGKDD